MAAETITTINSLSSNIWVTIYEINGDIQTDYGNVDGNGSLRDWSSGGYLQGSYYKVRAQGNNNDVTFDTEITIRCTTHNVVTLMAGSNNVYWAQN